MSVSSHQEIKKEIIRCGTDPIYFIKNYIKIQHPKKGVLPFHTYPFQDDCVNDFVKHRFNIVVKSRQLGISTITAAYALWMAIFHKDKNVLVIATKLPVAVNFIKKVKFMINNIPKWLLITKFRDTQQSIIFSNGSEIKAIPTSEDAGRSEALSLLIVDEAAHVRYFDEIWAGLYPTLSCVAGDTRIMTDKGFRKIEDYCKDKNVGDYFPLDGRVWGKDGLENLSHGYVSPESETIIFKTYCGNKIEVTKKHPLYVYRDGFDLPQMVKAEDIMLNDSLRIQYGMMSFGDDTKIGLDNYEHIDENLAYVMGSLLSRGKGYLTPRKKKKIKLIIVKEAYYRYMIFPKKSYLKSVKNKVNEITSKKVVDFIEKCGIDVFDVSKTEVPEILFRAPKEIVVSFLVGFFETSHLTRMNALAFVFHKNMKLINDIQTLMLNLGIVTTSNQYGDLQVITVKREFYDKFIDVIISKTLSEKSEACLVVASKNRCRSENVELIRKGDLLFEKINSIYERIDIEPEKKKRLLSPLLVHTFTTNAFHKEHFDILKENENILSEDEKKLIYELSGKDNNFIWDNIVSIEYGKCKTYDFTVPGTHTFLQNCILGSNTGGSAILLSTPKGVGGTYYKIYTDAIANLNNFNPIKLQWDVHPEHDEEWFKEDSKQFAGDTKMIAQEYLCSFVSSGDTFLQSEQMDWMRSMVREPIEKTGDNKRIWIWEQPKKNMKYIISADVSRGDAGDYSTFHIICTGTASVVAEFKGKLPPDRLGELLVEYGIKYNNALLCPEYNTYGFMTCSKIKELKYPRLYYKNSRYSEVYIPKEGDKPGFETMNNTKIQALTKLEEFIRNKLIKSFSQRLVDELSTYVWTGSKASSLRGYNDDLVMSIAIGTWLLDSLYGSSANYVDVPTSSIVVIRKNVDTILPPIISRSPFGSSNVGNNSQYPNNIDLEWIKKIYK